MIEQNMVLEDTITKRVGDKTATRAVPLTSSSDHDHGEHLKMAEGRYRPQIQTETLITAVQDHALQAQ